MRQYLELVKDILNNGTKHNDRTGVGTKSLFGPQLSFDLSIGFPLLTTKRLSFKWIAEELLWFISGSTDANDLRNRGRKPITIWDEWADTKTCAKFGHLKDQLGPVYGHQWRNSQASKTNRIEGTMYGYHKWYCGTTKRYINAGYASNGVDQLMNVVDLLQNNPNSRRIIISGWDPKECTDVALPPCHTLFQFKWEETTNKLNCKMYQRSADVFLGVPYNIASYSLLTIMLAKSYGMIPGRFIHTFGDVHVYSNHMDAVQAQIIREPRNLPRLEVEPREDIRDYDYTDFTLIDYDPYPTIKARVAV